LARFILLGGGSMRTCTVLFLLGLVLTACVSADAASWTDMIKMKGDFRYRNETITTGEFDVDSARVRDRIRARLGVEAQPHETVKLSFRIVTGSSDPVSTNQTLDDAFSHKTWMLDLAYVDAGISALPGIHVIGGKMANPFQSDALVWDGDLTPEGLASKYSRSLGTAQPNLTLGNFWIDERSRDNDSFLHGAQGGLKMSPGGVPMDFSASVGYFKYDLAKGRSPFVDASNSFGNTLDSLGHYVTDFDEVEVCAEAGVKAMAVPVKLYGSYVTNMGADSLNGGFMAGIEVGKAKEPLSWQLAYDYRRLEADAVLGAFTDSDPWGGGTDGWAHTVSGAFQIMKAMQLALTVFKASQGVEDGEDYLRTQLDWKLSF
jgi:hypothetical protein